MVLNVGSRLHKTMTTPAPTRIALKLAYIGDRYHGFQIQPNVRTVESELFSALEKSGIVEDIKEARYSGAARTDRGVHAAGQVVAFDAGTGFGKLGGLLPRIINSNLPDDIWVWAYAEVCCNFDPRRNAVSRTYRYFLPNRGYNVPDMAESSQLFIGTHDFSNFTKDRDDTVRTIDEIEIHEHKRDRFIVIDTRARSFLWNMVRRIVAALEKIGSGERDSDWILGLLNPVHRDRNHDRDHKSGIAPAPAYGLVLRDVAYRKSDVSWITDGYSEERMKRAFMGAMIRHSTMAAVYSDYF